MEKSFLLTVHCWLNAVETSWGYSSAWVKAVKRIWSTEAASAVQDIEITLGQRLIILRPIWTATSQKAVLRRLEYSKLLTHLSKPCSSSTCTSSSRTFRHRLILAKTTYHPLDPLLISSSCFIGCWILAFPSIVQAWFTYLQVSFTHPSTSVGAVRSHIIYRVRG